MMLSNPQMMDMMINSNPMLKQMVDSNPQVKAMMSNPEMMKAMMTPENISMAQGLLGQPQASNAMSQPFPNVSPSPTSFIPSPQPNPLIQAPTIVDYKTKYASQLGLMKEMGFVNEESNLDALKMTDGNVNAAVERILNMLH